MKSRTASRLAWVLSAFVGALIAGGLLLGIREDDLLFLLLAVPFLAVGTLVAKARPGNPVGWLFLGFAGVAAVGLAGMSYFGSGPGGPGSRPGADLAASLAVHLWHPGFSLFIMAFLLFPEGRLLTRRWRIIAWITAVTGIIGVLSGMLEHAVYKDFLTSGELPAPLLTGPVADVAGAIFSVCVEMLVGLLLVSAGCIFLRFRRSTGILRQQMKWVATAVVVFAVALPASLFLLGEAYGIYTLPLIPISAGIAILRYGLFDIDVIINRGLVYGALTALLGLVYAGGVVTVGSLLRLVDQGNNKLAIAASTLAVAALFRPARSRVQGFIDRRFYRSKYDAAQALTTFSVRLRDHIDLETLSDELLAVVDKTMRPSHTSLWLRLRQ